MQNISPMDWLLAQFQEECVFLLLDRRESRIWLKTKFSISMVLSVSETQVAGGKLGQMTHGGESESAHLTGLQYTIFPNPPLVQHLKNNHIAREALNLQFFAKKKKKPNSMPYSNGTLILQIGTKTSSLSPFSSNLILV